MKKKRKIKKEKLNKQMEVDVSGQLGPDGDTVFAFSNGKSCSILIESVVKREVKKFYLLSKKSPGRFYFNFYIGGLVILLSRLEKHEGPVYLDWELSGRENEVKGELLVKMKNKGIEINSMEIASKRVGKKSAAHLLAYSVYKKKKRADKTVTSEELWRVLK